LAPPRASDDTLGWAAPAGESDVGIAAAVLSLSPAKLPREAGAGRTGRAAPARSAFAAGGQPAPLVHDEQITAARRGSLKELRPPPIQVPLVSHAAMGFTPAPAPRGQMPRATTASSGLHEVGRCRLTRGL